MIVDRVDKPALGLFPLLFRFQAREIPSCDFFLVIFGNKAFIVFVFCDDSSVASFSVGCLFGLAPTVIALTLIFVGVAIFVFFLRHGRYTKTMYLYNIT